jgi:hypothetical protein
VKAFELFIRSGQGPGRGLSLSQGVAAGVVVVGLPLADMLLVLSTSFFKSPEIAMVWLPVGLAALGALICRAVRLGLARSVFAVFTCLAWCAFASTCLVVMDIFIMPF